MAWRNRKTREINDAANSINNGGNLRRDAGSRGGDGEGDGGQGAGRGRGYRVEVSASGNRAKFGNSKHAAGNSYSVEANNKSSSLHYKQPGTSHPRNPFGFMRLYKFLETPADDIILAINKNKSEWRALLESPEIAGDQLIILLEILSEKVCADIPVLQQLQMNALTAAVSCRPFIDKIEALISSTEFLSLEITSQKRNSRSTTPVNRNPMKILQNVYEVSAFVLKSMPSIAVDYFFKIVTLGVSQCLMYGGGNELSGKFQDLFQKIGDLSKKEFAKKETAKQRVRRHYFNDADMVEFDAEEPPNTIQEIEVIPSIEELMITEREEIYLRPNKPTGAYNDARHYLDVQFRLFREDFVAPLRTGLKVFKKDKKDYISGRKRMPLGEIRLYRNVTIIGSQMMQDTIVYKLQLPLALYGKIKWEKSKKLLHGSLILLTTPDDCLQSHNTHFGVVLNRDEKELSQGIVTVTWEGSPPSHDRNLEYLLFESEVYLEAYRHTLETLKVLDLERFPMKRFIVDASKHVEPPKYLLNENDTEPLNLSFSLANGTVQEFPPLEIDQWPTATEFGLDENQFQAFRTALTKEFTIIQGPPGTGKTFLGLKIAKTLLTNKSLWRGPVADDEGEDANPMIVVCYTNHALDQFLEGILKFYRNELKITDPDIVRVGGGGRCGSEELKKFNLRQVKWRKGDSRKYKSVNSEEQRLRCEVRRLEERKSQGMKEMIGLSSSNLQGLINFQKVSLNLDDSLLAIYPRHLLTTLSDLKWFGLQEDCLTEGKEIVRKWFKVRAEPPPGSKAEVPCHNLRDLMTSIPIPKVIPEDGEVEVEEEEEHDMDELMANRIAEEEVIFEVESQQIFQPRTPTGVAYLPEASIYGCSRALNETNQSIHKVSLLPAEDSESYQQMRINLKNKKSILENRKTVLKEIFRLYNQNLLNLPDVSLVLGNITENGGNDWPWYHLLKMDERWALYFTVLEDVRKLLLANLAKLEQQRIALHKELQEVIRFGDGLILKGAEVVGLTTTGAAKYNSLLRMMKSKIVIVEEAAEVLEAHVVTCITEHCQQLILIGDHKQLRPNPKVYELAKKYNLDLSFFERMINNGLHCYPLKIQHRMRPMIADLVKDTIYPELENHASVSLYPDVKGVVKNVFFISHTQKEESEKDSLSKSNVHEARFIMALCHHLVLQGYDPKQITILTMYMGQMFLLRKEVKEYKSCDGVRVTCVDNFQGEENDIILLSLVRSNDEGKIGFVGVDNRICVALSRAKHGLYVIGNLEVMFDQNATWKAIKKKLEVHDAIGTSLELVCVNHVDMKSEVSKAEDFKVLAPQGGCTKMCDTALQCGHTCSEICHAKDPDHREFRCVQPCPKLCENLEHLCKRLCYEKCSRCRVMVTKELPCPYKHTLKMFCFKDVARQKCYEAVEKTLPCEHTVIMACCKPPDEYKCKVKLDKELPCGHLKRDAECHLDPMGITCRVITPKVLQPCEHTQDTECWRSPDKINCVTSVLKIFPDCGHQTMIECHKKDSKDIACKIPCEVILDCGHGCTRMCHVNEDPEHLTFECRQNCARECKEGHRHRSKLQHMCHQLCPPCKVKFTRKLPCGHKKLLECCLDLENYKCQKKCERKLPCEHECPNLCFEECGPCKTEVTQQVTSCGHDQKVICGETLMKENCEVLVVAKNAPLCGHIDTKIPCKFENASPEEVTKLCKKPCEFQFQDCNHTCVGNCRACLHGRVHLKCRAPCGRSLVCGHRCNVTCSVNCPPCEEPCQMKCEHSKCTKKCGDSCVKCKEKCRWSCPHQKCTKRCGDLCDREPCDVPCPKTVKKCGHPCIGFCGEPCPPLCRICDREELTPFVLSGNEGEDDARFVFLPDCGHTIEVEGLSRSLTIVPDDGQIKAKVCPKCSTPITNCRRFGNLIRGHLDEVEKIKKKSQGNGENAKKIQEKLITELITTKSRKVKNLFPEVWTSLRGYLMENFRHGKGTVEEAKKKLPDEFVMASLEYIADSVLDAAKVLDRDLKQGKLCDPWYEKVKEMYCKTFKSMLERQPLKQQEVLDFNGELTHLDYIRQLMLRRSMATYNPSKSNVEAFSWFLKAKQKVSSKTPMTLADKLDFKTYLENLDKKLKSGMGISDKEDREIVTAVGMRQGHWFKCTSGHIYVITECGGATERGVCNECNTVIGGENQVVRGNLLASETDDATVPAFPTTLYD